MPWDVWVPAAAFVIALFLALALAPTALLSETAMAELQPSLGHWPTELIRWGESLMASMQEQGFWLVWSALFAVLAGLGLRLALRSWDIETAQSLDRLEHNLADAATRLFRDPRRAH